MRVTLTQHPVGQGGMMSGVLKLRSRPRQFHWVYDCGSNQTGDLNREIDRVAKQGEVDCLFLSHLDSDHVSGVDYLLSKVHVREVVLPYLNDVDRVIAIAHDASSDSLTGTFLSFLNDVNGWLSARGVQYITYILPRSDDDEGDGGPDLPPLPDSGEPGRQGEILPKWSRPPIEVNEQSTSKASKRENMATVRTIHTGASLLMETALGPLNWTWAPYAHRPSNLALQVFIDELDKVLPHWQGDSDLLVKILRDQTLLKQLRKCYDSIWSDHNLVSMALYAGPICHVEWDHHYVMHTKDSRRSGWSSNNEIGWLGTGDMHLNIKRRREKFVEHYKKLLDLVNVFGLPHHGAESNFDPSLLSAMPNAEQYVASTGKNGYGHPSKSVKLAIEMRRKNFIKVSSKSHSSLVWRHAFPYR